MSDVDDFVAEIHPRLVAELQILAVPDVPEQRSPTGSSGHPPQP